MEAATTHSHAGSRRLNKLIAVRHRASGHGDRRGAPERRRSAGSVHDLGGAQVSRSSRHGASLRVRTAARVVLLLSFASGANAAPTVHPSLDALVAEALQNHPALRHASLTAAAAWQVPSRMGSLPDPMLSVAVQNFRTDAPGLDTSPMSGIEVALKQDVPFPGKLRRRSAVAAEMAGVSDRTVEQERTLIALNVREAYWRLHFAERAEQIALENEKVLDSLANTVMKRFSVGQAAQQDALQVQVAYSRVRALVEERHEALLAAKHALNGAVARPPEAELGPTDEPATDVSDQDRPALAASVKGQNPIVRLHAAQVLVAERALDLASYERWPDFQLGVGYRFRGVVPGDPTNGADMFGATLGVTLPIWMGSKQNARVRQAREELAAAQADVEAADLDVGTELARTLDMLERLNREIALYRKEVAPQSKQALDASITDYQVGRVGFVSVLQNWQVQLDVELAVVRLLTEREERLAELQALAGDRS
jgi:cobalt-zinc-cadmium efflux system outer membrane protein